MERWFTSEERGIILFLVATLILGASIYIYKLKNPYFAPELKIIENEKEVEISSLYEQEEKNQLKQLIYKTKTKIGQSKAASPHSARASEHHLLGENVPMESGRNREKLIVNINKALEGELIGLPGIGPVYAQRIIDYREMTGDFKTLEELMKIKGIGEKKFEKLKDEITVK